MASIGIEFFSCKMEISTNVKKEKDSRMIPIKKVKNPEELKRVIKTIHDLSTELGDVSKHITLESKINSPFKANLIEWDEHDGEESEFQRSVRDLENKQKIQDNAASVKQAKNVINQIDLYLEDDIIAYIKERHPEYRVNGQLNEYIRYAATALSSQRDLSLQEKLKMKENYRLSVQNTTCSNRDTFFKTVNQCRDAEALIRLLDLDYTMEEMLFDVMYGFKSDMTLVKCQIEEDERKVEAILDLIPLGQTGRPAVVLMTQAQFNIPTNLDKLSMYVRNFKFPSGGNDIRQYAASLMTEVNKRVDGIVESLVENTVLSTDAALKVGYKKRNFDKFKTKSDDKTDKPKSKGRDMKTVKCRTCEEMGHYANQCPIFKKFLHEQKRK